MEITKLNQMFDVLKSRPKKRLVAAYAMITLSALSTTLLKTVSSTPPSSVTLPVSPRSARKRR